MTYSALEKSRTAKLYLMFWFSFVLGVAFSAVLLAAFDTLLALIPGFVAVAGGLGMNQLALELARSEADSQRSRSNFVMRRWSIQQKLILERRPFEVASKTLALGPRRLFVMRNIALGVLIFAGVAFGVRTVING